MCKVILCKDCKWWGIKPDWMDDDDSHDPEYQIAGGDGHKNCENPKVGGGTYNDESRSRNDSLNYYEGLGTGPLFGCIHGEAK